eukprot:1292844-Amphidinium_carterae.1
MVRVLDKSQEPEKTGGAQLVRVFRFSTSSGGVQALSIRLVMQCYMQSTFGDRVPKRSIAKPRS